MGFLDFLTDKRSEYHSGGTVAPVGPGDHALQLGPTETKKPSLLSEALGFLTSPGTLAAVGAGIKGMGGDSSGVQQAIQIGQNARQEKMLAGQLAEKKAAAAAKNAALKAAYKRDEKGRMRFDPAAYVAALQAEGQGAEVDLGEMGALERASAPRRRVISNAHGLYAADDEDGTVDEIEAFERPAPAGWEFAEDGSTLRPIKDGPYDPEYISRVSGVRRDAVVQRPMPGRPRRPGAPGGGPKMPTGFILD